MMYGDGWGGWGGMGWGMLLFWGLLVVAVIGLLRWLTGTTPSAPEPPHEAPGPGALDILAQRYARGEIDREEFEQKRRDLERL